MIEEYNQGSPHGEINKRIVDGDGNKVGNDSDLRIPILRVMKGFGRDSMDA
jgi:hypothetical protein